MFKKIGVIFIFLTGILYSQILTGQWAKFANYNDATSITSNDSSIIWMGTKAGLVRWNIVSNNYKIYDKSNGLPSVVINDLQFDANDNLWLATNSGIVKFDGGNFELFNYQNSPIPDAPFTKIVIDSNNNIYAAMGWYIQDNSYLPGGIVKFSNNTWTTYFTKNDPDGQASPPNDIIIFHNTLWGCTSVDIPGSWGTNIFNLINDNLITIDHIANVYLIKLTIDYQDSLWAGCGLRLFKRRNNSFTEIIGENSGLGSVWNYAWSNGYNGLWLGGSGPYLYYLNIDKNLKGIKYAASLPPGLKPIFDHGDNDSVGTFTNHLALSPDKQLFVSRDGLFLFNHDGIIKQHFQIPKTIDENYIYGLGVSPKNHIIISDQYSTQEYDGNKWISIGDEYNRQQTWNNDFCFTSDGTLFTNHNKIYGMWDSYSGFTHGADVDNYGNLWTAYGNLIEYQWPSLSKKEYTLNDMGISTIPGYYSPQLMDITVDKFNHIWADGWYDGAVMFDGSKWHLYNSKDVGLIYGWDEDYIFTDSKGRVWFTGNQITPNEGIVLYDFGKWSIVSFKGLYWASYVYQIAEDNFGNLWFATEAGLLEFDGINWSLINSKNSPLDTDAIRAVAVDQQGNIWIGTLLGLYVYNQQRLDLNSEIGSSSADVLSIENFENGTKIKFKNKGGINSVYKYELQRGKLPFKFWTITSIKPSLQNPDTLQLIDSSIVKGDYYYRIKEIDFKGKALYSPYTHFVGTGQSVMVNNFEGFYSGNRMGFSWHTTNEYFISYYKITHYDSTTNKDLTLATVKTNDNGSENDYETIAGDLFINSQPIEYRLIAVFADSTSQILKTIIFLPSIPTQFEVSQNYPNPFNGQTSINFILPERELVAIKVYDVLGKLVGIPIRKEFEKGYHKINLNLLDLASGIYLYEFTAGGFRDVKKMVLVK